MSRPLIGLLVATVAFFALWLVALKPSSSGSSGGLGQYQSAINAAHNAVKIANGPATAEGNQATPPGAPSHSGTAPAAGAVATAAKPAKSSARQPKTPAKSSAPQPKTPAKSSAPQPKTPAKPSSAHTSAARLSVVEGALRHHRVIAMLFYNPAAADDRAVKRELAAVPRHHGRVVKLLVPISEVSNFQMISNQVNVTQSPTLVVVDPAAQATMIVGFADTFEIAQRVDDALSVK